MVLGDRVRLIYMQFFHRNDMHMVKQLLRFCVYFSKLQKAADPRGWSPSSTSPAGLILVCHSPLLVCSSFSRKSRVSTQHMPDPSSFTAGNYSGSEHTSGQCKHNANPDYLQNLIMAFRGHFTLTVWTRRCTKRDLMWTQYSMWLYTYGCSSSYKLSLGSY